MTQNGKNREEEIFELSEAPCPACGAGGMLTFYAVAAVPVHSVLLLPTRQKALTYPKGNILLGFCASCGFISNTAFDPRLHEYSSQYEETQGFSATFQEFHSGLAARLIERHDLHGKRIIEIGCGKGEFLTMLCEKGENWGIGFDPAYVSARNLSPAKDRITFITDFYSEKYAHVHGDFVCCKMTLEHIPDTLRFMQTVRRSVGDRTGTKVFFMIPEVLRILRDRAFWDIYYEHCSYFSPGSLSSLFRRSGFVVEALSTEYDGQYLTIEARVGADDGARRLPLEEDLADLRAEIESFVRDIERTERRWAERLRSFEADGRKTVIWGGGSKGVAFLTKLGITDQIRYAVDINPYKHGTFMAGTGQEIVSPEFLRTYRPDAVVVMNPIYMKEIGAALSTLGLAAELLSIDDAPEGARP
jgi:SAM-dependent methyltransferase